MQPRKTLLIINPISGTRGKEGIEALVHKKLDSQGFDISVCRTSGPGDATTLAEEAARQGYDTVIAAGGDGTINETARALCETGVALGIIPCGSGNGLARHIGVPMDVEGALDVIAECNVRACDYGSVNERLFFCTFGMGFDAKVSETFAHSKRRGKMTYIKNTFKEYLNYRPEEYTITIGDEVISHRAFVVAVCNASQYGNNAYIAPHASITDGLLDLTVMHYGNILSTALVGIDLMTGLIDHNVLTHAMQVDKLTIERLREGPVHLDGEPMLMGNVLNVCCHHAGLHLYAPGVRRPFTPILTPISAMVDDMRYMVERTFRRTFKPDRE